MDGFNLAEYGTLSGNVVIISDGQLGKQLMERYKDEIESIFKGSLAFLLEDLVGEEANINDIKLEFDSKGVINSISVSSYDDPIDLALNPNLSDAQLFDVARVFHILIVMHDLEEYRANMVIPFGLESQKNSLRRKFGDTIYLKSSNLNVRLCASIGLNAYAYIFDTDNPSVDYEITSNSPLRHITKIPADNTPFPKIVVVDK